MKVLKIFIYIAIINLIFAKDAFAYIDPGTGSYIFQIVAASILTVIFSARNLAKFIRNFIKKIVSGKSDR